MSGPFEGLRVGLSRPHDFGTTLLNEGCSGIVQHLTYSHTLEFRARPA